MDFSKLSQTQLSSDTVITPFKCSEDDLNSFLFEDAKYFQKKLMAVTYLIEDNERALTVAYFIMFYDLKSFEE